MLNHATDEIPLEIVNRLARNFMSSWPISREQLRKDTQAMVEKAKASGTWDTHTDFAGDTTDGI